jgi:uncharacterized Fe-S cluster-containing radical SAM superfamily enzyme
LTTPVYTVALLHMKTHKDYIGIVPRQDVTIHKPNLLLQCIATVAIYSIAVPIALLDLWLLCYTTVYFTIEHIPSVPRKKYVMIDRGRLVKLSIAQRVNCLYCDYANGVFAWARAVAHQTEVYSCAIKHQHTKDFLLQKDYYPFETFL